MFRLNRHVFQSHFYSIHCSQRQTFSLFPHFSCRLLTAACRLQAFNIGAASQSGGYGTAPTSTSTGSSGCCSQHAQPRLDGQPLLHVEPLLWGGRRRPLRRHGQHWSLAGDRNSVKAKQSNKAKVAGVTEAAIDS